MKIYDTVFIPSKDNSLKLVDAQKQIDDEKKKVIKYGKQLTTVLLIINIIFILIFNRSVSIAAIIGRLCGILVYVTSVCSFEYLGNTKVARKALKTYKKEEKRKCKETSKSKTNIPKVENEVNKDLEEVNNMINTEFENKLANFKNITNDIETLEEIRKILNQEFVSNDIVKKYVK